MDKQSLFKNRIPEREIDLPGIGSIRVRGLSRQEALNLRELNGSIEEVEQHIIHLGMVDPLLSLAEVKEWAKFSPAGELEVIAQVIAQLSGLDEGTKKAVYKDFLETRA